MTYSTTSPFRNDSFEEVSSLIENSLFQIYFSNSELKTSYKEDETVGIQMVRFDTGELEGIVLVPFDKDGKIKTSPAGLLLKNDNPADPRYIPEMSFRTIAENTPHFGAYFGKNNLNNLLDLPNVTGIRCYLSQYQNQYQTLLLAGVDTSTNPILNPGDMPISEMPCPPRCDGGIYGKSITFI